MTSAVGERLHVGEDRTRGIDAQLFRDVFRRHAAGVVVITATGPSGPVGFTATSLASLSAEPPLVSFSLATTSSSWPVIRESETVIVHLLGSDHHHVARTFSARGVDRFAPPTRWQQQPTGEPLLLDATGWLRCHIEHRLPIAGHHLVIAQVIEADLHAPLPPLVYHDGDYLPG